MNERIDPDDLDNVERLCERATPGPWYRFGPPWFRENFGIVGGSPDPHVAKFVADLSPAEAIDDPARQWARNPADAVFIAAARSLLPALAAELRRAREDKSSLLRALEECRGMVGDANWEVDFLTEGVAALRECVPEPTPKAGAFLAAYDQATGAGR